MKGSFTLGWEGVCSSLSLLTLDARRMKGMTLYSRLIKEMALSPLEKPTRSVHKVGEAAWGYWTVI